MMNDEMDKKAIASAENSYISEGRPVREARPSARLIVAIAAATSALLGGLAAAWYYKKTLSRLQDAEQSRHDSKFGKSELQDDEGL
jgi:hypothetical protein